MPAVHWEKTVPCRVAFQLRQKKNLAMRPLWLYDFVYALQFSFLNTSLGYQPAVNASKRRRRAAGGGGRERALNFVCAGFGRRVETLLVFACSGQIPSGLHSIAWWHCGECRNRQKGNCRNVRSGLE